MSNQLIRCPKCGITPVSEGTAECIHCQNNEKMKKEFKVNYPKKKQEIFDQIKICIEEIKKIEKENHMNIGNVLREKDEKIKEIEESYRSFLENPTEGPGNIEQLPSKYNKFISNTPVLCSKCGNPINNSQFTIEKEEIVHNFKCTND